MEVDRADVFVFRNLRGHILPLKVDIQRWVSIHFKHPAFQVLINKNIKAEYLERPPAHWFVLDEAFYLMLDSRPVYLHYSGASLVDISYNGINVNIFILQGFP